MADIQLEIVGLSSGFAQKGAYTLILASDASDLKLPVVIGNFEAQSIALVMENIKPHRPLTHDLFVNYVEQSGIKIVKVVISELKEGVFFSKIVSELDGRIFETDSRTSDAIAIAIRVDCPIFTSMKIMQEAGVPFEAEDDHEIEPQSETEKQPDLGFTNYTLEELEKALREAEEVENYERAAMLRDEIDKRKD